MSRVVVVIVVIVVVVFRVSLITLLFYQHYNFNTSVHLTLTKITALNLWAS